MTEEATTSYTGEDLYVELLKAQDELFAWATGQRSWMNEMMDMEARAHDGDPGDRQLTLVRIAERDMFELKIAHQKVESLLALLQMQPLRPKVKPDVSGLVPKEAQVQAVHGDEDELPECHEDTCHYQEPHHHGFACDKTCAVCGGV